MRLKANKGYVDLDGNVLPLEALDEAERKLIARLRRRAKTHPDFWDFDSYWMRAVAELYDRRGLSRRKSRNAIPYRIGQDLRDRLGIVAGLIRPSDYRDELTELIDSEFASRREFCEATGISIDMLSHVLAGRKDLSLRKLTEALARIGYSLRIAPVAQKKTG